MLAKEVPSSGWMLANPYSFLPTELYNPKAFIAHAASLGKACAHCRRSSTAATRRCLASVSVRVARVVLSHPLDIFALVSRYLTNKLIGRGLILGRRPKLPFLASPKAGKAIRY